MNAADAAGVAPGTLRRLDHLGIVVESIDDASLLWTRDLGLEFEVDEQTPYGQIRFLVCGDLHIELIQPVLGSPLAGWRDRRGDQLHHIAFEVDDADDALARLRGVECAWRDEEAVDGTRGTRIAFLKPARAGAPIVELVQHASR